MNRILQITLIHPDHPVNPVSVAIVTFSV